MAIGESHRGLTCDSVCVCVYYTQFRIVLHTCCCHNKDPFQMFTCFSCLSAPSRCGGAVMKYCSFKFLARKLKLLILVI